MHKIFTTLCTQLAYSISFQSTKLIHQRHQVLLGWKTLYHQPLQPWATEQYEFNCVHGLINVFCRKSPQYKQHSKLPGSEDGLLFITSKVRLWETSEWESSKYMQKAVRIQAGQKSFLKLLSSLGDIVCQIWSQAKEERTRGNLDQSILNVGGLSRETSKRPTTDRVKWQVWTASTEDETHERK